MIDLRKILTKEVVQRRGGERLRIRESAPAPPGKGLHYRQEKGIN